MDISPTNVSRSKVQHADGTIIHNANISFAVTSNFLTLIDTSSLIQRGFFFDISIHDGVSSQTMSNCLLTNLTLSGSAGGIVDGNLTALSVGAPVGGGGSNAFIRDQEPLGYWFSGNTDVQSWTLTVTQDVSPVYINEDTTSPRYLKFGLWGASLDVTTYEAVQNHSSVIIATKNFSLSGNTKSEGYSFGGINNLGLYTHSFETAADFNVGSGDTIISV